MTILGHGDSRLGVRLGNEQVIPRVSRMPPRQGTKGEQVRGLALTMNFGLSRTLILVANSGLVLSGGERVHLRKGRVLCLRLWLV